MKFIKVVQYGFGSIGLGIVDTMLARPWVKLVGAIDIDKNKVGKDVGELLPSPRRTGVVVSKDAEDVLRHASPDVVTHSTSSHMKSIQSQLIQIIEHRASVVSTAEELSYPFVKHPDLSRELDEKAKENKVVVGTGINPGFLMDTLAATLCGVCQKVNSIRAENRGCFKTQTALAEEDWCRSIFCKIREGSR